MKKLTKLTAMLLAGLLLCSCGQNKTRPMLEAYKIKEGHLVDYIEACVDVFNRENPDTYVIYSMGYDTDEGAWVSIYGPGCESFVNSEYVPKNVDFNYPEENFNLRQDHPIPREPQSEVTFEGEVTMRMGQSVYPRFPEYIYYSLESDGMSRYGVSYRVYKLIDDEWQLVHAPTITTTADIKILGREPTLLRVEGSEYMGEGLYKVVNEDKYYAEFAVSSEADELKLPDNYSRSCPRASIFYETGLPENCRISTQLSAWWPLRAQSYATDPDGNIQAGTLRDWTRKLHSNPDYYKNNVSNIMVPNEDWAEVISPYKAAEIVLPELFKLENAMVITDVSYTLAYHNGDRSCVRPSWVFILAGDKEKLSERVEGIIITVDALTGELVTVE